MTNTLVKGRGTGTVTNTLVEGEMVAHKQAPGTRTDLSNADDAATLDAKANACWKVGSLVFERPRDGAGAPLLYRLFGYCTCN